MDSRLLSFCLFCICLHDKELRTQKLTGSSKLKARIQEAVYKVGPGPWGMPGFLGGTMHTLNSGNEVPYCQNFTIHERGT